MSALRSSTVIVVAYIKLRTCWWINQSVLFYRCSHASNLAPNLRWLNLRWLLQNRLPWLVSYLLPSLGRDAREWRMRKPWKAQRSRSGCTLMECLTCFIMDTPEHLCRQKRHSHIPISSWEVRKWLARGLVLLLPFLPLVYDNYTPISSTDVIDPVQGMV